MNSGAKSTEAGAAGRKRRTKRRSEGFAGEVAKGLRNGMEQVAGVEKAALDIVGARAAEAIEGVGQAWQLSSDLRGMYLMAVAGQAVSNVVRLQKNAVDLAVRETDIGIATGRDCAAGVSGVVGRLAEGCIAAHHAMLDFAAEQNRVLGEIAKVPAVLCGHRAVALAQSVQRGVAAAVEAQRDLLTVAAKRGR